MNEDKTVLVMAGAREAHAIILGLQGRRRSVIASLPETERGFDHLPVPTRTGPFTSRAELAEWIDGQGVATVIDASHPFDADISAEVFRLCCSQRIRYLRLLRAPWRQTIRDRWTEVSDVREAAERVPPLGVAFTNTGWLSLTDFDTFTGRLVYMRQIHPGRSSPPYAHVRFVEGTPPFSVAQEMQTFRELGITHLICRNVGGSASMSKVLAARSLALSVHMVARPILPDEMPVVETVAEALAWEATG